MRYIKRMSNYYKYFSQSGGASCSLCGAPGVTKVTCPFNPNVKKSQPSKHNKKALGKKSPAKKESSVKKSPSKKSPVKKNILKAYEDDSDYGYIIPLLWASNIGDIDMLNYLISKGVNIDLDDHKGDTALGVAIEFGTDLDIIKLLLDNGANINAQPQGVSYLLHTIYNSNIEKLKLLLSRGADINLQSKFDGTTILDYAYKKNKGRNGEYDNIIKFLIANGAKQSDELYQIKF